MPPDAPGPSGQSVPPLALRILRGPAAGRTVTPSVPPTSATSLTLGRKPGRDLQIPDPGVSEGHALLEWEARKKGGAWTIRDVGSSNGTRHNGEELVREGASHDLEDGDELMLGTHTVAVVEIPTHVRPGLTGLQLAAAEETRLTKQAVKRADAEAARLRSWHASALKKVDAAMKAAGAV